MNVSYLINDVINIQKTSPVSPEE